MGNLRKNMKPLIVVIICVLPAIGMFICPDSSQRRLRRKVVCNNTKDHYSCLYDVINHVYTESCTDESDFVRPGKRYVIKGGRGASDCEDDRYQPTRFYSNENTRCIFKKSTCNEIGQVVVDDGSTTNDRTCRCDYRDGYSFITTPTNPCRCNPAVEDCSCYRKSCSDTQILSQDYECVQTNHQKDDYVCNPLPARPVETTQTMITTTTSSDVRASIRRDIADVRASIRGDNNQPAKIVITVLVAVFICVPVGIWKIEIIVGRLDKMNNFQRLIMGNWKSLRTEIVKMLKSNSIQTKFYTDMCINEITYDSISNYNPSQHANFILLEIAKNSEHIVNKRKFRRIFETKTFFSRILEMPLPISELKFPSETDISTQRRLLDMHENSLLGVLDSKLIVDDFIENCILDVSGLERFLGSVTQTERNKYLIEIVKETLEKGSYLLLAKVLRQDNRSTALAILTSNEQVSDTSQRATSQFMDISLVKCTLNSNYKEPVTLGKLKIYIPDESKEITGGCEDCKLLLLQHLALYCPNTVTMNEADVEILSENISNRLKTCVEFGKFKEIIKAYFHNGDMNCKLPNGSYSVCVTLNKDKSAATERAIPKEAKSNIDVNIIGANKSLLIAEMDTQLIMSFLTDMGIPKFPVPTERHEKAEKIFGKLLNNVGHNEETFCRFLKKLKEQEMEYIYNRLKDSQDVFRAKVDTSVLKDNIWDNLPAIIAILKEELDDVLDTLSDRDVISKTDLEKIDSCKSAEDKAVYLVVMVVKRGRDSILHLMDAFFIYEQNDVASKVLSPPTERCFKKDKHGKQQIQMQPADSDLLFDGTFRLDVFS